MSQKPTSSPRLSRRTVFAGAGTLGALAAAAAVLPGEANADKTALAERSAVPDARDGRYQLTAHVRRYYGTTKV